MKISIAIVTKDRLDLLSSCFNSLEKQTYRPEEIVVIDNGSLNKADSLCRFFSNTLPIKYFYESTPSRPKARNIAINVSSHEIVVFIDDDCQADTKWLENIKKCFETFPDSFAVQGRIDSRQKNIIALTSNLQRLNNISLGYLETANLALNKTSLNRFEIKFDETLLSAYDFDISVKIIEKNGKICFAQDALVYHSYTLSLVKEIERYFTYGFWDFKLKKAYPKKGKQIPNLFNFINLLREENKPNIFYKICIFCYYLASSFISLIGYLAASFYSK